MPKLLGEAHDLSEAGLVRRPVRLRPLFAEALLERLVDQAVLGRDLGGGAPGDLPAHLQRFQHRDAMAAALEEQGGAQAHDAGPDHRDIDLEITLQRWVSGRAAPPASQPSTSRPLREGGGRPPPPNREQKMEPGRARESAAPGRPAPAGGPRRSGCTSTEVRPGSA